MFSSDFYEIGEKKFSNWIKEEQLTIGELALHGGSIDILKFNSCKISEVQSKLNLYLTLRGVKNRLYFQKKIDGIEIPKYIHYKNSLMNGVTELPFQKKNEYRNVDSSFLEIEKTTVSLMLHYIFDVVEFFKKDMKSISGEIYLKKGSLSPFDKESPPIYIINNLGNVAKYSSTRIILHFYNNDYDFHHIITSKDDISNIDEEVDRLKSTQTLQLKTIEKGSYKLLFSHKAITKLLYSIKKYFSSSYYFENSSLFSSKRFKKIASHLLNVYDTPFHPLLPSCPFDEIAQPKTVLPLIENGYLSNLTFSHDESLRYKSSETAHNRLYQNFSTPNHIYLKGNSDDFQKQIESESNIIKVSDIETPNWRGFDDLINIFSKGELFLMKNGNIVSKLTPINIETTFSNLFMSILSFGKERESLAFVTPETLFNSIKITPI